MTEMESNRYDIQIIIPVYNSEGTLNKCIRSLQEQTYTHWQAILIDDCSTDAGYNLLLEYAKTDYRLCVYKNEKNIGVSATRNRALKKIDADWVAFLDSDDWWEPDMLDTLYQKAKEGIDVVQCRYMYDFSNGTTIIPKGVFKSDIRLDNYDMRKVYYKMLTGINMNHVCMKLMSSKVIRNLCFDENMKTAEDLDFCAKMFKSVKSYYFIDKVLYHYFRGGFSLTGSSLTAKEKWHANCAVASTIHKTMKEANIKNPIYYLLVKLRIYIITLSKIFRNFGEKSANRK